MNHYGKLAATALRLLAVAIFFWSFLGVLWSIPVWRGQVESASTGPTTLLNSTLWLIGGAVLYAFSGKLAQIITRNLGDDF